MQFMQYLDRYKNYLYLPRIGKFIINLESQNPFQYDQIKTYIISNKKVKSKEHSRFD